LNKNNSKFNKISNSEFSTHKTLVHRVYLLHQQIGNSSTKRLIQIIWHNTYNTYNATLIAYHGIWTIEIIILHIISLIFWKLLLGNLVL